jgi:hypothetical protein
MFENSASECFLIKDFIPLHDIVNLQNILKNALGLESTDDIYDIDDRLMELNSKYPEKIQKFHEVFSKIPEISFLTSLNSIIESIKILLNPSEEDVILLEKGFLLTIPNNPVSYTPEVIFEEGSYIDMWTPFLRERKFIINNELEIKLEVGQTLLAKNSISVKLLSSEYIGYYIRSIYFYSNCKYKFSYPKEFH